MRTVRLRDAVRSFFFRETNDFCLTTLRIGLGFVVVAYCLALRGSWNFLLSESAAGLAGRRISEAFTTMESPWIPKIGWLIAVGKKVGLDEQIVLQVVWVCLLIAAIFLIAGLFCRSAAITCWFLHLAATKSGGLVSYGFDDFLTIGLFYLMLSPMPDRHSLDARLWKTSAPNPALLGLLRRVLQLHLCLIYFFGGLTKALGSGWWNGENLWRALTRPPFAVIAPEAIARWAAFLPVLGICIWLLELSYPILIWPARTRLLWLGLICLMHLGIGFGMGMHLFAAVMIVLNLAAFGPALVTAREERAVALAIVTPG